jgi:hypothetical protein
MIDQEYEDTLEQCAAEICEYLDIDGYADVVANIIEKYFPDQLCVLQANAEAEKR